MSYIIEGEDFQNIIHICIKNDIFKNINNISVLTDLTKLNLYINKSDIHDKILNMFFNICLSKRNIDYNFYYNNFENFIKIKFSQEKLYMTINNLLQSKNILEIIERGKEIEQNKIKQHEHMLEKKKLKLKKTIINYKKDIINDEIMDIEKTINNSLKKITQINKNKKNTKYLLDLYNDDNEEWVEFFKEQCNAWYKVVKSAKVLKKIDSVMNEKEKKIILEISHNNELYE